MRPLATLFGVLLLALVGVRGEAQMTERAQTAADGVKERYGTEDGLRENGFEPLSTQRPMLTVAGDPFDAQMSCRAASELLRVTLFPAASSDITRFTVDFDRNLDGTVESREEFAGPFAGVCNNGIIACTAGTFEDCRYLQYRDDGARLTLAPVTIRDLGACYCINASCGNNLLFVNSRKVVADLAAGIVQTLKARQPRLTVARVENPNDLTIAYYGQESGCGVDQAPEQYFSRPNELAAAGVAAGAQPGSVANFMLGTTVSGERGFSLLGCEVRREMDTVSYTKNEILRLISSTRGAAIDCGPGCLQFRIGDAVENLYGDGSGGTRCRLSGETQQYLVGAPDRIESVVLRSANFDDAIRLRSGAGFVYNSRPGWTAPGIPEFRCDYGNHAVTLNTDLRGLFASAGSVPLEMEVAHDRRGEGWFTLEARVREGCEVTREEVVNGCVAAEANAECALENETVDGVATVINFMTTGLSPLPSARPIGTGCEVESGVRPWWVTSRRYRCRTRTSTFDGTAAEERYRTVHESFDATSGGYTDRRRTGTAVSFSAERISLPPSAANVGCVPMCRTRKLRPGIAVGDLAAPANRLNATGVAYEFTFRECEGGTRCPLESGEEEVAPCDCRSNFAAAASMMQAIRMVGKDMVCTVPPAP